MTSDLASTTWPVAAACSMVLVPIGSIEQHGPHLPVETDSLIARAVTVHAANDLARSGELVLTAPVVAYGASGEHQSFPGTCSIGRDALRLVLIELVRSIRTWAERVVFVNAHGGNVWALTSAIRQLRNEGHDVAWVACATEEVDAHAGYTETSLVLHLQPDMVRLNLAEAGNTTPVGELMPAIMSRGISAVSPNGVLGDPSGATAQEGERVLVAMTADVVDRIRSGLVNDTGMLRLPATL